MPHFLHKLTESIGCNNQSQKSLIYLAQFKDGSPLQVKLQKNNIQDKTNFATKS